MTISDRPDIPATWRGRRNVAIAAMIVSWGLFAYGLTLSFDRGGILFGQTAGWEYMLILFFWFVTEPPWITNNGTDIVSYAQGAGNLLGVFAYLSGAIALLLSTRRPRLILALKWIHWLSFCWWFRPFPAHSPPLPGFYYIGFAMSLGSLAVVLFPVRAIETGRTRGRAG